ncbi:MAG: hypothetical protein WA966_14355 [Ornithinimicrobium sp.]
MDWWGAAVLALTLTCVLLAISEARVWSLSALVVVAADVTGQATGLNTMLRTIGGALGVQITATLIASTSTPELGYRTAFAALRGALALLA